MHYAPHSAREFLPGEHGHRHRHEHLAEAGHADIGSAPLYFLAAVMGVLIALDVLFGLLGPATAAYREPLGVRLALVAAILGGARIVYHSLEGLFSGRVGADLALSIATLAAIILQEYFVAAMVVFIATCGECLEAITVGKAQRAVRKILELTPRIVHVRRDERIMDVPLEELVVGEVVIVRPGERVPADGVVLSGRSAVDQSALTGESLPVDKQEGDAVFAGTLNQFGALEFQVDRLGGQTTLGQVIRLVAEASQRKAPIERTADRYARYFLPVVLAAAVITHVLNNWGVSSASWNWMPTLAVLVVACPCPLILATPAAVMAAMAWLASRGVVIKGSIALERLAGVDTFVFDKTGTLTEGRLSLGEVRSLDGWPEAELLRLAAAAEQRSEHPLARLLVQEVESRNLVLPPVEHFTAHPGAGVVAELRVDVLPASAEAHGLQPVGFDPQKQWSGTGSTCRIVIGNRRLMEQQGLSLGEEVERHLQELDAEGQTSLLVAVNGRVAGIIGARDTLRAEAPQMLHELDHLGIEHLALLTGDRRSAAESLARQAGYLHEVQAELLPADKARWIEQARREGRRIAMVGDGVNDAPALASADVGLALGGVGTDIAAEAGDVVLMGDPLAPLPGLLRLARQTVRIIRQNIVVFAFIVNGVAVLLAAWGILSPVTAAIYHEFASLAVLLNAMRLLGFERWNEMWLGRLTSRILTAADECAAALDPHQAIAWLILNWRRVVRALIGTATSLLLLIWGTWNVAVVEPGSQAVVTRFGRYETTLGPGFYWRWPPPIESLVERQTDPLRSIEIGFRTRSGMDQRMSLARPQSTGARLDLQPLEWDNPHTSGLYERRPEESLLLTGDEVLVELGAVVQYRIRSLQDYLFSTRSPEQTLRSTTESVLRQIAAHMSLEGILTADRARIEREAADMLQERVDSYRLGIEVVRVLLLDVHPPLAVVSEFRQVASSEEDRQRMINEADADYVRKVLEVAGKATADRLARLARPAAASPGVEVLLEDDLWRELVPTLAGTAATRILQAESEGLRRSLIAQGQAERFIHRANAYRAFPAITRVRLYWEAIEKPLREREKIILDPQVAGRSQLFFSDLMEWDPAVLGASSPGVGNRASETRSPDPQADLRSPDQTIKTTREP